MPTLVQLLVALAVTGLLVGFDRPSLLVVGAVAGVWPDFLGWALTPWLPGPDELITPDPDRPAAATVTTGLRLAAQAARAQGRAWRVRLNPVLASDGPAVGYELDLDRHQTTVVRVGAHADRVDWRGWLPRHPLPLRVSADAVDLMLTPLAGGRLASDVTPVMHPAGHTWLWLPVWLAMAVAYPELAFVAGVMTALHLALDYGGHATLVPLWPLSARAIGGLRTWNGARRATAFGLGGLAAFTLVVASLAGVRASGIEARPERVLALGAILIGMACAGARVARRPNDA